jgi:hypothetical protein
MSTAEAREAFLEQVQGIVSTLFGARAANVEPRELLTGDRMLTWPVAGEPGVGEWYTAVVFLWGDTATIEHCYCTEGVSRTDDTREYGPFEVADPQALEQIGECLRRIAEQPKF